MSIIEFRSAFESLTENPPFPWQERLYCEWFSMGKFPQLCDVPTGLGKTSVIPIWLIALAARPTMAPRRLVYVVNRRTVVDQATREAERIRERLLNPQNYGEHAAALAYLRDTLPRSFGVTENGPPPLAISTLRGQFADNREWLADPARAAILVGTVDMIGSRLLFSGYGIGFKSKPIQRLLAEPDRLMGRDHGLSRAVRAVGSAFP